MPSIFNAPTYTSQASPVVSSGKAPGATQTWSPPDVTNRREAFAPRPQAETLPTPVLPSPTVSAVSSSQLGNVTAAALNGAGEATAEAAGLSVFAAPGTNPAALPDDQPNLTGDTDEDTAPATRYGPPSEAMPAEPQDGPPPTRDETPSGAADDAARRAVQGYRAAFETTSAAEPALLVMSA